MDMDQSFFFHLTERKNSAIKKNEHPVNWKLKFRRIDKRFA